MEYQGKYLEVWELCWLVLRLVDVLAKLEKPPTALPSNSVCWRIRRCVKYVVMMMQVQSLTLCNVTIPNLQIVGGDAFEVRLTPTAQYTSFFLCRILQDEDGVCIDAKDTEDCDLELRLSR